MDTIYNFSSIVKTKDGKTYPINCTNTLSASYTANSSNASDIVLGYAAAASFKASLNNLDRFWDSVMLKGAELQLNITGGLEGYRLGIFDIEEVRKNEGCINIESIDRMVLFDVKFMGATFPCTVGHLVQVLCDQVGIPLATPVFPNSEVTIKNGEDFKGVSCRVILTSCMEVAGSFAKLNAEGQLEIKWYDINTVVDTFSYSQMSNFTPEENPVEITGVRFETADDTFVAGNDGFPLDIPSNNPILKNADEQTINDVLNVIYQQRVKNMAYLPCSFNVPSKPALRPGDVVKTIDKRKKEALALITEITFTDNIGVKVVSCGKAKAHGFIVDKPSFLFIVLRLCRFLLVVTHNKNAVGDDNGHDRKECKEDDTHCNIARSLYLCFWNNADIVGFVNLADAGVQLFAVKVNPCEIIIFQFVYRDTGVQSVFSDKILVGVISD